MRSRLCALVLGAGSAARLEPLLGAERAAAVDALLAARALEWASAVADRVSVIEADRFAAALGAPGAGLEGGADAAREDAEAVLLVAPALPAWPASLGPALLDDLGAGCPVVVGPIFDGGAYAVALAGEALHSQALVAELDALSLAGILALAERSGWEVGLLRSERALRRSRDVAAMVADPRTDERLRALLDG